MLGQAILIMKIAPISSDALVTPTLPMLFTALSHDNIYSFIQT
ncbi:Uncharacterised protein [Yersinia frederiksenii]|nr:Uncharacterised protein [Yersinia frederiksenii]